MEAPFFVQALLLFFFGLVNIDNLPLLVLSSIVAPNSYGLTFLVFTSFNIKDLVVVPVDELAVLILEHLEPSWVGAPDLHVIGSTSTLDIPRLVVISSSDCQWLLVEVPDLGSSTVWNLNDHISVVNKIKISVIWKCWNDVEVSFNIESKSVIELSLGWLTLPLINIDDIKLLIYGILLSIHTNVSIFCINSSLNFNDLSFLVDNWGTLVSEELPPSWVGSSASDIGWTTVWLDIKWMWLPVVVLNGLWNSIKIPLLSSNILSPSLQPNIVGTMAFKNSLECKSWSNIEWSVDMEAPFFAHSLGLFSFSFVNIDDLPLLVFASVVAPNSYSLAFNVFSTSNIKDLVVSWVDKLSSFVSEQLEPSRVGAPDLHVVGSTSTLDIPRLVVISGSDSQW
jgi:hypothetical protein